jgi:hypothetical protein
MTVIMNQAAADTVIDLHRGIHAALAALVEKQDVGKTQLILRQLDERFANLRNNVSVKN